MSRIDEPVDSAWMAHVARCVVESHRAGRRCRDCTDDGCDRPAEAQALIDKIRAERTERAAAAWAGR